MKLLRRDFIHAGCRAALVALSAGALLTAQAVEARLPRNGQKLRFVSANIAGPSSAGGLNVTTGATVRCLRRVYCSIGSGDVSKIVLSFFAFYIAAFSGITGCNGFTINSVAIEANGTSAPVTFGGSRSLVVGAGASDIQADPFLPSAVGLSKFAQGSVVFLRYMLTYASPTTDIAPGNGFAPNPDVTQTAYDYDPAKVIVTNGVDGTGALTYTMTGGGIDGTDIKTNAFPFVPAVLGAFVSGDPATWAIAGDSAGFGTGANGSIMGARGLSWAFYPGSAIPTSPAGALANWNLCCNSGAAIDWGTGSPWLLVNYLKYFKYGLDEYGGNQFNIPASQAIWAQMYGAGIKYVIKTSLIPRTTDSIDFWATEANQTISTGWGPGSGADVFETGLKALVSPTLAYIDHTSIRGSTSHWLFITNGVPGTNGNPNNFAAADGQHPSNGGYLFKCYGAAAVTTPGGTVTQSLQALIASLP